MKFWERAQKVLGINQRNINYVYAENRRTDFELVNNKLKTKEILKAAGMPHLRLLFQYQSYFELTKLRQDLLTLKSFAIKPARGLGGGGILVFDDQREGFFITTSGKKMSAEEIESHAQNILFGVFSIDNTTDIVFIEEKIKLHPFFNDITYRGVPDIRIIVYRKIAVQAMLRLPTQQSDGKANLHQGGIGVGVDLTSGRTLFAKSKKGYIERHPDTGAALAGLWIPQWSEILALTRQVAEHFPLGYLGFDWVLDGHEGPKILELNARPGLEIQNANQQGLAELLQETRHS